MTKVMIATPMYGAMCTASFAVSMINLMSDKHKYPDIDLQFVCGTNDALITRSRNSFVQIFLKTNCDYLLFVDSDIEFKSDEIMKMIQTNEDFVCGIYPRKKIDWTKVKEAVYRGVSIENLQRSSTDYLFKPSKNDKPNAKGLIEIERAGTGMMLIHRKVFEKLKDKVASFKLDVPIINNMKFDNDHLYKEYFFTSVDPDTKEFTHEDYNFCKLWIDSGGKIYGAPWVFLKHAGMHVFG
jgi:hypothetical protein